ncbi:SCO4225 family membrane protein [Streptomyces macrosporus]|uniref:Integral membrane protein n=1 Tax=Streptomyces macrosporus TaxID=44032 RepID=A0ABN3K2C2_9ACTN
MGGTRRGGRVLTAVAGTWTARVYLALCCALLVWVVADTVLVDHPDASMAAVFPLLATAPLSLVFLFLPGDGGLFGYVLIVTVSALVNAALLNWAVRAAGRREGSTGDPR